MMARLSRRNRKRLVSEINVVPYIDVMLVLLVIFMVTAPMLTPGVAVDVPKGSAESLPSDTEAETVTVYLKADKTLYIDIGGDTDVPVDIGTVEDRIMKVLLAKPGTNIQFRASAVVPYQHVMDVMIALQKAGADKVGYVAENE